MHLFAILIARFYTLNKTFYNKTQTTTNGKLEFPFFKYMIFRYPLTNNSQNYNVSNKGQLSKGNNIFHPEIFVP